MSERGLAVDQKSAHDDSVFNKQDSNAQLLPIKIN